MYHFSPFQSGQNKLPLRISPVLWVLRCSRSSLVSSIPVQIRIAPHKTVRSPVVSGPVWSVPVQFCPVHWFSLVQISCMELVHSPPNSSRSGRCGPVLSGCLQSGPVRSGPVRSGLVWSAPVRQACESSKRPLRMEPVRSEPRHGVSGLVWSGSPRLPFRSLRGRSVPNARPVGRAILVLVHPR